MTFRIPFYVGPLNNAHQKEGYAWVVRREKGKVYPWNFEQKVDLEKSAEEFILRATNKCTYLKKEEVSAAADFPADSDAVLGYLRGETLPAPEGIRKGWVLVAADGLSLGWAKASGGTLKNHYPKGLRWF